MSDLTNDWPAIDYDVLEDMLQTQKSDPDLFNTIVNCPFEFPVQTAFMFLGIVVLLLVDKKTGLIDRVALSDTELAKNTTEMSYVPFNDIKIPVDYDANLIALAIKSGVMQDTTDWKYLFAPALTPQQARLNQASGGIAYSAVYPLKAREGGAMIFSYFQYQGEIGEAQSSFMQNYVSIVDKRLAD